MSSRNATNIAANAYRTRLVEALVAEGARWLMSTSKVLKHCSNLSELCSKTPSPNTNIYYTEVDLQGHACDELKDH